METLYTGLASFILINVLVGGIRIIRGPTHADRMLASQFLGTAATAILLVMAELRGQGGLRNLALIIVALAAMTTVAFVRAYTPREGEKE